MHEMSAKQYITQFPSILLEKKNKYPWQEIFEKR